VEANNLSKTQAKRSSSETLLERSAPDAARNGFKIDRTKIYPELIADLLMNGHRVKFRAPGYSMYPIILHEDVITVEPVEASTIRVGDIALYRKENSLIAHRVIKILERSERNSRSAPQGPQDRSASPIEARPSASETLLFILCGDARPTCDDPVAAEQILGKVVLIETNGHVIDPYSFKAKLTFNVRRLVFRLKRFMNQV
jgi:hypothetical protein